MTKPCKSSLLCPEGAALFERHSPHFSTAVYTKYSRPALAILLILSCGCRSGLTAALVWHINEYHPAPHPRLLLATVPGNNDVLVAL